jgi:hypothetical protein
MLADARMMGRNVTQVLASVTFVAMQRLHGRPETTLPLAVKTHVLKPVSLVERTGYHVTNAAMRQPFGIPPLARNA